MALVADGTPEFAVVQHRSVPVDPCDAVLVVERFEVFLSGQGDPVRRVDRLLPEGVVGFFLCLRVLQAEKDRRAEQKHG